MTDRKPRYALYMLAHNEEAAIGAALRSVLAGGLDGLSVHVMDNGSTDGTGARVSAFAKDHPEVTLHTITMGDKCNAWNVAVHDVAAQADVHFFMDGDVRLADGALEALVRALKAAPMANAATAVPFSGRSRAAHIAAAKKDPGLSGNLYALKGDFIDRIRAQGIRLPVGMVGDDSYVGLLAAIDLGDFSDWQKSRILVVEDAGFLFDSISITSPAEIALQLRRMRRYSRRRYENQLIGMFLRQYFASDMPAHISSLHSWGEKRLTLGWRGLDTLFDWLALRDIRKSAASARLD